MPQLVPFNFNNQTVSSALLITASVYLYSKYILVQIVWLFSAREIFDYA